MLSLKIDTFSISKFVHSNHSSHLSDDIKVLFWVAEHIQVTPSTPSPFLPAWRFLSLLTVRALSSHWKTREKQHRKETCRKAWSLFHFWNSGCTFSACALWSSQQTQHFVNKMGGPELRICACSVRDYLEKMQTLRLTCDDNQYDRGSRTMRFISVCFLLAAGILEPSSVVTLPLSGILGGG